tara:strand:+ start:76 stop:543 length:468 start_codon:yes stop_codon:yes gene_type:complete
MNKINSADIPQSSGMHSFRARIYYDATDAGGIVYHTEYLTIAEHARTEALRALGFYQSRLTRDQNILLTVRRCNVQYITPAFLDDLVEVRTDFNKLTGARIFLQQTIHRIDEKTTDDLLVSIETEIACVSARGKAKRLPEELKEAISSKLIINEF